MTWFFYCLRNYGKFDGRAGRAEYWHFFFSNLVIFLLLGLLDASLGTFNTELGVGLLSGIYMVAVFVPSLATSARRLHDTGRSGWWQLVNLVPYLGWLIMLVFCARRGVNAPYRFGDPATHAAVSRDT